MTIKFHILWTSALKEVNGQFYTQLVYYWENTISTQPTQYDSSEQFLNKIKEKKI